MRCPFCTTLEDRVVETRSSDGDQVIRRRRECAACGRRFTTYERIELELPVIVKKDGRREPYDRAKLMSGLKKACEKRPVPIETLDQRVNEIERNLQDLGEKEITSSRIGDAVLAALRHLDDVAYLRFASVYLSYNDLGELMSEMQRLVSAGPGTQPAPAPEPGAPAESKPSTGS